MKSSKLVGNVDYTSNLKMKLQRSFFVARCTWGERANTKWKFCKLTNVTVFASVLGNIPMGYNDTVLLELFWSTTLWRALLLREKWDNPTMASAVCLEQFLYICILTTSWRKKLPKFSFFFSLRAKKGIRQKIKVFKWTTIQKLKTFCSWIFFCMILLPLMEELIWWIWS